MIFQMVSIKADLVLNGKKWRMDVIILSQYA